jgi:protein ImuB
MRDSKVLLKLVRLSLQSDPPKSPIQKIAMTVDAAPPRVAQSGLFAPKGPDPEKLELTIARLAKLVGETNIGVAELLDTHRAETFRMARWAGSANSPQKKASKNRKKNMALRDDTKSQEMRQAASGFRVMRPALAASVEISEARPVRVSFAGMQGDVVAASGPWRSSGEWWQEDGWDQDEWDLAIDFGSRGGLREKDANTWPQYGVYRIYYDAPRRNWFVRGFYD